MSECVPMSEYVPLSKFVPCPYVQAERKTAGGRLCMRVDYKWVIFPPAKVENSGDA